MCEASGRRARRMGETPVMIRAARGDRRSRVARHHDPADLAILLPPELPRPDALHRAVEDASTYRRRGTAPAPAASPAPRPTPGGAAYRRRRVGAEVLGGALRAESCLAAGSRRQPPSPRKQGGSAGGGRSGGQRGRSPSPMVARPTKAIVESADRRRQVGGMPSSWAMRWRTTSPPTSTRTVTAMNVEAGQSVAAGVGSSSYRGPRPEAD